MSVEARFPQLQPLQLFTHTHMELTSPRRLLWLGRQVGVGGIIACAVPCLPPAGVGGGEPRLVLLRVPPAGRRPAVRQLLPGLPPQVRVGRVQAPRRRLPLAVRRLQGRRSRLPRSAGHANIFSNFTLPDLAPCSQPPAQTEALLHPPRVWKGNENELLSGGGGAVGANRCLGVWSLACERNRRPL